MASNSILSYLFSGSESIGTTCLPTARQGNRITGRGSNLGAISLDPNLAAEQLLRKRDLDERRNWGRMRGGGEGTCAW